MLSEKPMGSNSLEPGSPTHFSGTGKNGTDLDLAPMDNDMDRDAVERPAGAKPNAVANRATTRVNRNIFCRKEDKDDNRWVNLRDSQIQWGNKTDFSTGR